MALPQYSTGTVSVAAGGTVVTCLGGMWSGINVKQGDFISIANLAEVLITEVTDETHLKIAPWQGPAQTNAVYAIYQNYVGRYKVRLTPEFPWLGTEFEFEAR